MLFRWWSTRMFLPRSEERPGPSRYLGTQEPLSLSNGERLCAGGKVPMEKWSPVVWHPANGTWCSLSENRVSITDTGLRCQMLPPDRTICKIPNFWELLSSERVATQLKVLCKQHMLDVWCAELVCSTQSTKNCTELRSLKPF